MRFIIKRRVLQMQRNERFGPITKKVRKHVLYPEEAHNVIKDYMPDLSPEEEAAFSTPMRIVKMNHSGDLYWLREYKDMYYSAKIGTTSEVFIAPKLYGLFEEIPLSTTIEILLKDCKPQTGEDTTLYLSVFYDADEQQLSLQTLNLRGKDIRDFPHDYWEIGTIDLADYDGASDGCCGSVRFVKASDTWEMNLGGLEVYDTIGLWTGTKTLKIFKKEDYGYTIAQMLDCWDKFWRVYGY